MGVKGVVLTPQGPGAHSSSAGESWEAARGPSLGLCPGDTRLFLCLLQFRVRAAMRTCVHMRLRHMHRGQ